MAFNGGQGRWWGGGGVGRWHLPSCWWGRVGREKGSPWAEVLQPWTLRGPWWEGPSTRTLGRAACVTSSVLQWRVGSWWGWSAVGGGGEGGVSRDCVLGQTQAHSHGKWSLLALGLNAGPLQTWEQALLLWVSVSSHFQSRGLPFLSLNNATGHSKLDNTQRSRTPLRLPLGFFSHWFLRASTLLSWPSASKLFQLLGPSLSSLGASQN